MSTRRWKSIGVAFGLALFITSVLALGPKASVAAGPPAPTFTVGFDTDAAGNPIPHLTAIDAQYAAWGIHFNGVFFAGRRDVAFPTYSRNLSLNYLCTFFGTADGGNPNCLEPVGGPSATIVATFD